MTLPYSIKRNPERIENQNGIKAAIVPVPHVDAWHGICDLISPNGHRMRVVASPGQFGVMNTMKSYFGYTAIVPDLDAGVNECTGTSLLLFTSYRPIQFIHKVDCPVLMIGTQQDALIDIRLLRQMANRNNMVKLIELPVGHFDIYNGEWFEKAIIEEFNFLSKQDDQG